MLTGTQTATYWGSGVINGFGKRTFAAPISLVVRWQEKLQLVLGKEGEDIPCRAQVWVPQVVEIGGYLALGDYTGYDTETIVTDPTTLDNAYIIFDYESVPSVLGETSNMKAFLRTIRQ